MESLPAEPVWSGAHGVHRVSKGPKMVLSFGRRQKLSFLSQIFLSGHIYPITQEFA